MGKGDSLTGVITSFMTGRGSSCRQTSKTENIFHEAIPKERITILSLYRAKEMKMILHEMPIEFVWDLLIAWNAKCPIFEFLGNFTPKTSNYCLYNRALGFPGGI